MSIIKIGLEAGRQDLQKELQSHPCRYFFILMIENRAALCIETCNERGENLLYHVVDGLMRDSDGNLVSAFDEELQLAMKDWIKYNRISSNESNYEELYSISPAIADKIRFLPGFIDWIISIVLIKDRNLLIYPASWA